MLKQFGKQELAALCMLGVTLAFVFVNQTYDIGFEEGHRGWCSANVMAVIDHATPSNGFVGYSLHAIKPDGRHGYSYFDRYPVFFSVGMHVLLNTFELSRGDQIYVARQAMNLLYVLSLLMAVAFLIECELPLGLAVAAVALAGSGKLLVTYRDMIHFDQAALLGFMGLLWAIARWYRTQNHRFVLIASAIAVLMGRGYASFAVLGVWWSVELVRALLAARAQGITTKDTLKRIAFGTPSRACILAIALAGSCLAYNIWTEAKKRDVPIAHVGIVQTAIKRLTLDPSFNRSKSRALAWAPFSRQTAQRTLSNLQPFIGPHIKASTPLRWWGGTAGVMVLVALFIASRKRELRAPLVIASLAGIAWIFPMRGLTAFHEFTTMFMLSLSVVFMASWIRFVPTRVQLIPALLACLCLGYSTYKRNKQLGRSAPASAVYTKDFAAIEAKLKPGQPIRTDPDRRKLVRGVPYAIGFFLPDQPTAGIEQTRFLVTTKANKKNVGRNLTPQNKKLFLYEK